MKDQIILNCLKHGKLTPVGQFVWGSNATFLVEVECEEGALEAVYKPKRGERVLFDFPAESLAGREVAAFLLSEALGWGLVPPTVFREDGPAGPGSLQWRVPHDAEQHYFTFSDDQRQRLRVVALFDLLANNADRKGGHILLDGEDKLWLIDHGICFHAEPKLRMVVWDFVGEEIPAKLRADLERLAKERDSLRAQLEPYLTSEELDALEMRLETILAEGRFPVPPEDERAVPWPLI